LRICQDVLTRVEPFREFIFGIESVKLAVAEAAQPQPAMVTLVSAELLPDAPPGMGTPGNQVVKG